MPVEFREGQLWQLRPNIPVSLIAGPSFGPPRFLMLLEPYVSEGGKDCWYGQGYWPEEKGGSWRSEEYIQQKYELLSDVG